MRAGAGRTWAGRAAIVVAALAAIATSPARWSIAAPAPATRPAASSATLVMIEASQHPNVFVRNAAGETIQIAPLEQAAPGNAWAGRADYLISAGNYLDGASIMGICSNAGMCSGSCTPPPDAFVRFGRIDAVTEWKIEVESPPQAMTVGSAADGVAFDVVVEATRKVDVTGHASGSAEDLALLQPPTIGEDTRPKYQGEGTPMTTKVVAWRYRWDAPQGTPAKSFQWIARATIRGYCPRANDAACAPPEGQRVRIVSVTPRAAP